MSGQIAVQVRSSLEYFYKGVLGKFQQNGHTFCLQPFAAHHKSVPHLLVFPNIPTILHKISPNFYENYYNENICVAYISNNNAKCLQTLQLFVLLIEMGYLFISLIRVFMIFVAIFGYFRCVNKTVLINNFGSFGSCSILSIADSKTENCF